MPIDPALLVGRWMHSDEEDTADVTVFRPVSFKFPRSRGREGFELRPDQSLVILGIGPTDRVAETAGTWKLEDGRLLCYSASSPNPVQTLEIVSVDQDRLLVKK